MKYKWTDREMDAMIWMMLNDTHPAELSVLTCRHVDGDIQPYAGYPIGHISPPRYVDVIRRALSDDFDTGSAGSVEP